MRGADLELNGFQQPFHVVAQGTLGSTQGGDQVRGELDGLFQLAKQCDPLGRKPGEEVDVIGAERVPLRLEQLQITRVADPAADQRPRRPLVQRDGQVAHSPPAVEGASSATFAAAWFQAACSSATMAVSFSRRFGSRSRSTSKISLIIQV